MSSAKTTRRRTSPEGFPSRLRQLRKQRDLSQMQLGKLVGVHFSHIGRYERGDSRPAANTLRSLAEALGVSADYLLNGAADSIAKARLEDLELLRQFQQVEKLPDEDKAIIKHLLEAFLFKRQVQALSEQ